MSGGRRVFRFPGSSTSVSCSHHADLEWLIEFLRPSFWSRRAGSAEWSVDFERDDRLRARLLRQRERGRRRLRTVFHQDTRTERLPVLFEGAGATTLWDPRSEAACEVSSTDRRVRIVAGREGPYARFMLMRFVRERAMRGALEAGHLLLHAAGFEVDKRAVLMPGRKRSGKTSLLLHALGSAQEASGATGSVGPVRYLANDRVVVQTSGSRPLARGLPTIASLRAEGPGLPEETRARIAASGFFPTLTVGEAAERPRGVVRPWQGTKYTLSPAQLCALAGARATASAPVGAIVFPDVSGKPGRIQIVRLDRRSALRAMHDALFRAGNRVTVGSLFSGPDRGPVPGRDDRTRQVSEIVETVPCYSCTLGLSAFRDRGWLDRLRSRLG